MLLMFADCIGIPSIYRSVYLLCIMNTSQYVRRTLLGHFVKVMNPDVGSFFSPRIRLYLQLSVLIAVWVFLFTCFQLAMFASFLFFFHVIIILF